jgi:hypothetical protein
LFGSQSSGAVPRHLTTAQGDIDAAAEEQSAGFHANHIADVDGRNESSIRTALQTSVVRALSYREIVNSFLQVPHFQVELTASGGGWASVEIQAC